MYVPREADLLANLPDATVVIFAYYSRMYGPAVSGLVKLKNYYGVEPVLILLKP